MGGSGAYIYKWNEKQEVAQQARTELLAAQENEKELVAKLEAIIKAYPNAPASATALLQLAENAQNDSKFDKALTHYETFLRYFPPTSSKTRR